MFETHKKGFFNCRQNHGAFYILVIWSAKVEGYEEGYH